MAHLNYYLGPWAWQSSPVPCWTPPAGTLGCVDLASLTLLGSPAGSPRSVGFFATPSVLPSEYTPLGTGDCRELPATTAVRSAWQGVAGYRPQGDRLVDLLMDHLTAGSDPDGASAVMPLVPGVGGWLDLHLGGHSRVLSERFEWGRPGSRGRDHTPKLRALLRRQFRGRWEAARDDAGRDHARRCLDMACEKYGLPGDGWRDLVPPDLLPHVPGRLPHATTITESFDKADSDTLGPDLSWTEEGLFGAADWDVASNRASSPGSSWDLARADSDLSGDDHYAQAVVHQLPTGSASQVGPLARYSAAAKTAYSYGCRAGNGDSQIMKIVAASPTALSTAGASWSLPDTVKAECDGSTVRGYVNGAEAASVTDTAITGNTRCGLICLSAGSGAGLADEFEAADLGGGGGGGVTYTQLERGTRGLCRGLWTGRV